MRRSQSKQTRIVLMGLCGAAILAAVLSWTMLACRSAESGSAASESKTSGASHAETRGEGLPASSDTSAADALELVEVLVIDRANDKPVAHAELVYRAVPHDYTFEYWDSWLTSQEFDAHMGHAIETVTADAGGKARVKKPEFHALVTARAGELWGYEVFRHATESPWRIEVDRDVNLSARVVDTRGLPVGGARVVLRKRSGERPRDFMVVESRESDGLAVLPYAGYIMRRNDEREVPEFIALSGVFEKPVEVALDLLNLPTEPVQLVVPPGGECEVVVVGPDGEATADKFEVTLRQLTSYEMARGVSPQADPTGVPIQTVGGRALFPHVVAGVELFATALRSGFNTNHSARGPGPTAIGQRATLTVRLGETLAILRGRALDADGNPLKKAPFRIRIESEKATALPGDFGSGLESDEEGRFRVDVRPRTLEHGSFTLVLLEHDHRGGELRSASRPLPADLPPGVYDLGDFALVPVPVLASGRVVDVNDAPVHHATIAAAIQRVHPEYKDKLFWQPATNAFAVSDAQGRFVLRGRVQADTLALSGQKEKDSTADPVLVARGATDVVLQIRGPGAIAGRVLLDPSLSNTALEVFAERFDGEVSPKEQISDDGSFALRDLRPGLYTVRLRTQATWRVLHSVEDVRVHPGATTRDPRLDPLDLRTRFAAITLTIVDPDGEPVRHGVVLVSQTGTSGGSPSSGAEFENGKAVVMRNGGGVGVMISSTGFRDARLENVREDRTVALRRAPRVKVVLAGGQRPPDKPFGLGVELAPTEPGRLSYRSTNMGVYFDAQGRLSMIAPDPGRMNLLFRLSYKPDDDHSWETYVPQEREILIEVRDVEGEQVFEVDWDATALAQTMEQLRKGNY